MPKAFTKSEKKRLKNKLFDTGEELFSQYGLKKTTIKDLTQAVGISQGAFYSFFDSKEELYFAILEKEEEAIQNKVLKSQLLEGQISASNFKKLLLNALQTVEKSSLLKSLYQNKEDYQQLLRKLPAEKIEAHIEHDKDKLKPLISKLKEENKIIDKNSAVITAVIRSLFLLTLHKEEIGKDIYPETIDLIIELISQGLIKE
jgi:AcrR family transcriptional regulator